MVELTLKVLLFRFQIKIEQTVPTKNLIKNLVMLPRTREAPQSSNSTRAAAQNVAAKFNPNNNYGYTNSPTLGMKKFIAAAILNFKARSFQTARALLTGSSSGLLDL